MISQIAFGLLLMKRRMIELNPTNIICGCCGAIMAPDEYDGTDEDAPFIIVDVYDHWVDISDAIIGD